MRATESLKAIACAFVDLVFPQVCPLCRQPAETDRICSDCAKDFETISNPLCTICGAPFETESDNDHPCGACIKDSPSFDRAASLYYYKNSLADAIRRLKYSRKGTLAAPLAALMAEHPLLLEDYDFIAPVPLHVRRLRERGFNQSGLLAAHIGKASKIEVNPFILERPIPTLPQAGMKSRERTINVRGAFSIRKGISMKGKRILLIDDVYTTGATSRECARTLKKGGAEKVNILTLARVILS